MTDLNIIGSESVWCKCEGRGTCIGCLIQNLVREHYGIEGERYLAQFVPGIMMAEKAIEGPKKAISVWGGMPVSRAISSGNSMSMGMGTVNPR